MWDFRKMAPIWSKCRDAINFLRPMVVLTHNSSRTVGLEGNTRIAWHFVFHADTISDDCFIWHPPGYVKSENGHSWSSFGNFTMFMLFYFSCAPSWCPHQSPEPDENNGLRMGSRRRRRAYINRFSEANSWPREAPVASWMTVITRLRLSRQ